MPPELLAVEGLLALMLIDEGRCLGEAFKICGQQDAVGITHIGADQLVTGQASESLGERLAVAFVAQIEPDSIQGASIAIRKENQRLADLVVDGFPGLEKQAGSELWSLADPGDNTGDDTGTPAEVVPLEQGVDQGAFSGFDRTNGSQPYLAVSQ